MIFFIIRISIKVMQINLGDIYWLNEREDEISHPHVVVRVNESDDTFAVCSLTTNMNKANMPGNVILDIGEGNLEKQSIVEVYKELTITKSDLKEYIGSLNKGRVSEILNGINFIQKSFFDRKN
jgi:mRNA interferase MazF